MNIFYKFWQKVIRSEKNSHIKLLFKNIYFNKQIFLWLIIIKYNLIFYFI